MTEGTVKWFNDSEGFGDSVTFDTEKGPKGPKAVNVVRR